MGLSGGDRTSPCPSLYSRLYFIVLLMDSIMNLETIRGFLMRPKMPKLACLAQKTCPLYTFSSFMHVCFQRKAFLRKYCKSFRISGIGDLQNRFRKISNRYNQVAYLTQDTTWESDKNTLKHHKQEPRGQPFPSR